MCACFFLGTGLIVFLRFHDLTLKRFRGNKKWIHSLFPDKQYSDMLSVVRHCARCRLGSQNDLHYPYYLYLLPSQPHPSLSAYSACGPAWLPYWLITCTSYPSTSPPYSCLDSISFPKCHMLYTGLLLSPQSSSLKLESNRCDLICFQVSEHAMEPPICPAHADDESKHDEDLFPKGVHY